MSFESWRRSAMFLLGVTLITPALTAQESAPASSVTKAQLEKLLVLTRDTDADTAASTHAQLEAKRKTLPAWFPKAVWDDVERKVEAIHYADVVYPVYAKYLSSEQAEVEMLIYSGPTGQKIAAVISGKSETVGQNGLRGSAADQQVSRELHSTEGFQALMQQRFAEMTPEERTRVTEALPGIRAVTPKIDDETHAAYRKRSNEVVQQTIAAHQAELVKAQQGGR